MISAEQSAYINSTDYNEEAEFQIAHYVISLLYPRDIALENLSKIIYLTNRRCALQYGYVRSFAILKRWKYWPRGYSPYFLSKLRIYLDESSNDVRSKWYKYFSVNPHKGLIRLKFEHNNFYYSKLDRNFCRLLREETERYLEEAGAEGSHYLSDHDALKDLPEFRGSNTYFTIENMLSSAGLDEEVVEEVLSGAILDFTLASMREE